MYLWVYKYIHTNIYLCACISFSWKLTHIFTIEYRGMQIGENGKARKVDISQLYKQKWEDRSIFINKYLGVYTQTMGLVLF